MFGARLGDHHYRDINRSQRAEEFMGHARDADHPCAPTLIRAMSSTAANPFIGASEGEEDEILVPGASGLKVFLIQTVIPFAIAGYIVFG